MVAVRIRAFRSSIAALMAWGLLLTGFSHAITIRVPQDYVKIQDAIVRATHGDVIVVSPGVYVENISFLGKNVVLRSTNPTNSAIVATTIIDGNKLGPVVTFWGSETSSCTLSGFTIKNATTYGGIFGGTTKARIEHNVITNNSARYGGGLYDCDGTIQNNVIANNSATWGHGGGGLYDCVGTIRNNTIYGNSAQFAGGGLYSCSGVVVNCIIWGNTALRIPNYPIIRFPATPASRVTPSAGKGTSAPIRAFAVSRIFTFNATRPVLMQEPIRTAQRWTRMGDCAPWTATAMAGR